MKWRTNLEYVVVAFVLFSVSGICAADEDQCFLQLVPNKGAPGMQPMLTDVKLEGTAKGGELVLLEMTLNPQPRYLRIETHAGEAVETVLARMAAAFNEFNPFNPDQRWNIRVEGNLLKSFPGGPGSYLFAGTETGLGIPPPPTSLSVSYDPETQEVSLYWENPDGGYDGISCDLGILPGTATNVVWKSSPPRKREISPKVIAREAERANKGLQRFFVIGCRDGVLSNAAVITLDYYDQSQQELDTQPFTAGICPNWKAWSHGDEPGMLVLQQGAKGEWKRFERFDREPAAAVNPKHKLFFQRIKTRSASVTGGVYRKFLGLKPGHTYRVRSRMNTFTMDQVEETWSFSFYAVPLQECVFLSPEQMAGVTPLPDGRTALPIVSYGPNTTTKGHYVESSTGTADFIDITLPPDATAITVWFRYNGPPFADGVGFDWIKLKDVTQQ